MPPILQEIIGAGFGGVLTLLIIFAVQYRGKIGHLPKRMDRVEAMLPMMLRAFIVLYDVNLIEIECQQGKECNGDLTEAMANVEKSKSEMMDFLSSAAISRKGGEGK